MKSTSHTAIGLLATLAAGCGSSSNPPAARPDGGSVTMGKPLQPGDGGAGDGGGRGGTCAQPVDIQTAGTRDGDALVYTGTTTGLPDNLHPYGDCVAQDAAEAVFTYRVPTGVRALAVSTEGSDFDTAVYVRSNCSQAPGSNDRACNNDSYDDAPRSLLYVTNLIEGEVLFIVVDGNAVKGGENPSSGRFRVSVRPVAQGGRGMPCRPEGDMMTAARCDAPLRCSGGAGADGTALCVETVAAGMSCDQRGFTNTCEDGAYCVMDPTPPEGAMPTPACATPGTRAGAPCRTAEPRCDGALVCGAGDNPVCVRMLALGMACDPEGAANRCPPGLTCSPLGDAGGPVCHPL